MAQDAQVIEKTEEPEEKLPEPSETEDVIDTITPRKEPRTWTLSLEGEDLDFVQKPLSYFGKMEFMGLVGSTLDKALSGPAGLSVGEMFDETRTASDFRNLDTFAGLIAKFTGYAPDFLKDSYCIWLNIPDHVRPWAKVAMENLSDDDGVEMIEVFLDQNLEALEGFFRSKVMKLWKRATQLRKDTKSPSSTPSKRTPPTTPKQ